MLVSFGFVCFCCCLLLLLICCLHTRQVRHAYRVGRVGTGEVMEGHLSQKGQLGFNVRVLLVSFGCCLLLLLICCLHTRQVRHAYRVGWVGAGEVMEGCLSQKGQLGFIVRFFSFLLALFVLLLLILLLLLSFAMFDYGEGRAGKSL